MTTTSTSTASREPTSTARSPGASGTRTGDCGSPSATRCAGRGRRSSCGPTSPRPAARAGSCRCVTSRSPGGCPCRRADVEAGEHLLVSGANGSGKSTLLGVLSGRLAPTSGSVGVAARTGLRARPGRPVRRSGSQRPRDVRGARRRRAGGADAVAVPGSAAGRTATPPRWVCSRSASVVGWGWRSPWRPPRTCCSSTSRRTTSPSRSRASSRRPWRPPREPSSSPPTTAGCAAAGQLRAGAGLRRSQPRARPGGRDHRSCQPGSRPARPPDLDWSRTAGPGQPADQRQASERDAISASTARVMAAVKGTSSWTASTKSRPALRSAVASSLPTSRSPWRTGSAK